MDTKPNPQQPQGQPQGEQKPKKEQPRSPLRNWLNWLLLAALLVWNIFLFWPQGQPSSTTIPYSTFLAQVQAGNVRQVSIQGADIKGAFAQPVPAAALTGTPATPGTP